MMKTMMDSTKKTLKVLSLLMIGLLSGAGYVHVAAQGGSTPIRITSQADPGAMDLEPNINWTKGNITGYNETEIIASQLDIVNNTSNSNQQFYLDLSFEHARTGVLGILRLETTGVLPNAPITTNVSTTNPFLSERDGLDNDLDGKIDNPGEPPVSQGTPLNQVKSRFHPMSFSNRTLDDLAGATTNGLAGSATRTYYLVNRAGSGGTPVPVQVTISGPFVSDKDGISKIPGNIGSAPALDDQDRTKLVGYYRVAFTLAQPNDKFILQFGARISQEASRFPGASLSWGIAGSTQNVPIPVNRILVPDLEITKSVSPTTSSSSPALPGDTLTYSLRVRNLVTGQQGGGDAIDTYIVDTLPADVTFDASGGSSTGVDTGDITVTTPGTPPVVISGVTLAGNALTINLGNIDADGDGSVDDIKTLSDFTISFRVTINANITRCEPFTNTGRVNLVNTDANPANNTSSVTSYVCPLADVTIDKVCPAGAAFGSDIDFTLNYSNLGKSAAQGVTVVDTLPSGVTFKSASSGCAYSSQTGKVTCNIGTLAGNNDAPGGADEGSATITVNVNVSTGTLINSATISTTSTESNTQNNFDQCSTPVSAPDVTISKNCPDPVTSGTNITYTLTFGNEGTADAPGVSVVDKLPSEVTFVSASGPSDKVAVSGQIVTFDIGALAVGATGSRTITVTVNPTGGTLTNTATISTTAAEPDKTDNTSTCTSNVRSADVTIEKVCPADPVISGNDITYSLNYKNLGSAAAANVSIVDTLPSGVTFVSATGGGTFDSSTGKVTFNIGTLAADDKAVGGQDEGSVTITVTVTATGGTLPNVATISTSTAESDSTNNTSRCTNNVISADIALAKSVIEIKVKYSVVVRNDGTAQANGVTLTDTLPVGMVFVAAESTSPATANGQTLTYDLENIAAGTQKSVTIVATVAISSGGLLDLTTLQNSASATTTSKQSNTGNDSDSITVKVGIAKP